MQVNPCWCSEGLAGSDRSVTSLRTWNGTSGGVRESSDLRLLTAFGNSSSSVSSANGRSWLVWLGTLMRNWLTGCSRKSRVHRLSMVCVQHHNHCNCSFDLCHLYSQAGGIFRCGSLNAMGQLHRIHEGGVTQAQIV